MTLTFRPLPAGLPDLDQLPAAAVRHMRVDRPDSYPCRRCLRDAEPGERVVLLSYDPFVGVSPYSQPGPIYVHEKPCAPRAADLDRAPVQLTRRRLSVRSFNSRHLMLDAQVIDGAEVEQVAEAMLGRRNAAYLHVHNAAPGCFAVRIDPVVKG
jgi:hypothetical protein